MVCPPMSMVMRSHLVSWLRKWLQVEDLNELGRLGIEVHSETVSRIDFEDADVD